MRGGLALLAAATLGGCDAPALTAETFAAEPDRARAVVADCDAGRRRTDCDAARAGLAEARRRARMAVYRSNF